MRQYEHTEESQSDVSVEKVPYMEREVLVRVCEKGRATGRPINVVGFIEGDYMIPRRKPLVPLTNVHPMTDPKEIIPFTDMLRERGERGPINYWT